MWVESNVWVHVLANVATGIGNPRMGPRSGERSYGLSLQVPRVELGEELMLREIEVQRREGDEAFAERREV